MIRVELSSEDVRLCSNESAKRIKRNRAAGRCLTNDPRRDTEWYERQNLLGVVGELSVAKFLGMRDILLGAWWATPSPQQGQPDLPPDIEVKAARGYGGNLLIPTYEWDRDHGKRYILVIWHQTAPHVVGWADAELIMEKAQLREPYPGRPCYVLKQSELHRMETFDAGLDWITTLA